MQFSACYSGKRLQTAPFSLQPNLRSAADHSNTLFLTFPKHKTAPLEQYQRRPLDYSSSVCILSSWPIKQPDIQLRIKFNL